MCFTAESATNQALKYAKHRGDKEEVERLQKLLLQLQIDKHCYYNISGFAHPKLIVFTNTKPYEPQLMSWGLIPSWVKKKANADTIRNQTLNARIETLFEKASFKNSATEKRCLIYLDAFYEHHHYQKQTYPFRISRQDDAPMVLAGIWSEWIDVSTGEVIATVSIVTTVGNNSMAKIHNNPKAAEARMPVILGKLQEAQWLAASTPEKMQEFRRPYEDDALKYYTVKKLLGKSAIGNFPEAIQPFVYPELIGLLAGNNNKTLF
jgi:putative SOS response-associated peptidase YedK